MKNIFTLQILINACFAGDRHGPRTRRRHGALASFVAVVGLIFSTAGAAPFTPGNLAIVQADASANNTTASVIELVPNAANPAPGNIIAIDGTTAGIALRFSGSATSTLYLGNSADGTLLALTGHNSTSSGVNANTLLPRGVATFDAAGTFSLATTYTGGNGNQTRSATAVDNTHWFIGDQGGLYTNGASAASAAANLRGVKAFGSAVYGLQASSVVTNIVVSTIASPTATSVTGLPGLANNAAGQDFYLISSGNNGVFDVLYVLSATTNTAGTISKFSLVSGSWAANGTFTTTFGGFGLAAAHNGSGSAYLYVSTGLGALTANNVLRLTDTAGYNTALAINTGDNVTLYTAPAGKIVKGVAFAPVAPVVQPDLTVSVTVPPTALANAHFDFTLTASNIGGANATGVAVDFTLPSGLAFVSAAGDSGFAGAFNTGVVHFTGGSINGGAAATLTVTVSAAMAGPYTAPAGAAVIDPGTTIAELNEGNNTSPAPATINVLAASNDANLANLVLSTGAFSPAFAAAKITYAQVVPNATASLTVTPTKAHPGATITVNGAPVVSGSPSDPITLSEGLNVISTVVTAEDGTTTKTYTANVIRQANVVLGPGSIAFTGLNADGTDNLAFVALQDLPAHTVIFFTDEEWNGTDWADAGESAFAWMVTADIPGGTIVTFDNVSGLYAGATVANFGTVIPISDANDNPGLSNNGDAVFAFQGTGALNANGVPTPGAFLSLIATDDPVALIYSLTGTGLSEAAGTAVIFTETDDGVRYIGARNGQLHFADYLPLIADRATNWETVLGGDGTTYLPFSPAPFTAGPTVIVTINDVSISEGNTGTTDLTFTVTRGNNTGAFTLHYDTADGAGITGATVADNDYQAASGVVTFTQGGALTQPVTILVNGDTTPERNEKFFVNLSNVVSTVGNAVISDGQGIGTILTDDPAPPLFTTQPTSQAIATGSKATLTVAVEGFPLPTFQWYEGTSGDTANPIASATSATFTTPVLLAAASYWVRATNSQGFADSNTANITVALATPFNDGNINVLTSNQVSWNPAGVNVGGTQFVNLGLQGVGRFPAIAIDPATGESIGSISDMQITGWHKNGDGTFSGTMNTLPDRGFNSGAIFSNYAARINSYAVHFTPYTSPAPTTLQNQLEMTFAGSTRFTYDHDNNPLTPPVFTTGLLANGGTSLFGTTVPVATGPSIQSDGTVTDRLTLDSEGLILDSRFGKAGSGWIGDEYGAYIYHFNSTKQIDGLLTLPAALIPHATAGGPISFIDVPANVDGRRVNQGMEGIAQSPDGSRLFGLMQSATMQDSGTGNQGRFNTRLLVYDIASSDTPTDPVAQYVIQLPRIDDTGSTTNGTSVNRTGAQSCIVALNDHQLLILSRDGNGRGVPGSASPVFKSILLADLSAATNIDGAYDAAGDAVAPLGVLAPAVTPISWKEALNMIGKLGSTTAEVEKFGLNLQGGNGDINTICEKWESIGLVSANDPNNPTDYFLFIGNDNDFLSATGKYLDNNGVIQSYDAGLENDTLVLVYRVRFTAPELLVQQPVGTEVATGGSVSFGPVNPGDSATKTFTVKNTGSSALTISGVGVTGINAADFTVDLSGTSASVAPGTETPLVVTFAPSTTGPSTATLQIANNDFDEGSFAISLTGNGNTAPSVAADHATVIGNTGSPITNTGTFGDIDGDAVTLSASVGIITPHPGGTWSWSITSAADVSDVPVTITADDGTATATTIFTYTSHSAGLAGNYVALLTGPNGAASLHVKITAGHRVTGYVRLPNGTRVRLPSTIIPGSNTATLTLSDGSTLTLTFDSFGHVTASLSGPSGSFSGGGDLAVSTAPAGLPGSYAAIVEAGDGALGWLQMIVSTKGAIRLAGKLPDGTSVSSGAGTNVERDSQVAIMILSSAPGHPQVFGEAAFANLATSDISAASLIWTNGAGFAQGLILSGAKVGAAPGTSLPLSIDRAGLNITGNVTLGTPSSFLPPVIGLSYTATTGRFNINFRSSLPHGPIVRGSGVYQPKLGAGAGNFIRAGAAGRVVIGTLP